MLSEVFWVAFVSSITALVLGLARMAYKSKCTIVECCCIKVIRNVEVEEKELEFINKSPSVEENKI